mgnify:FL=1
MKLAGKAILIGCISFFVLGFVNMIVGIYVSAAVNSGDSFVNSYFYPLYTAVTVLIALVISCTYVIVSKLNQLLDK